MITKWKPFITATLCTVALRHAWAQAPEFAILEMERENTVAYVGDLTDPFKIGTSPTMVNANLRNFMPFIGVADIVSVNGKPARGSWVARGDFIMLGPSPMSSQAIGDIARGSVAVQQLEILQSDGTPVGSIMIAGFPSGLAPPGAPPGLAWNLAVTGGTGAFLGARGMFLTNAPFTFRAASMEEDPANRRTHGGPSGRFIVYLIPMSRPEIVNVLHSDFTLVTAAKPARADEVLIVSARGLGPTRPGVDPGMPFPLSPVQIVNSPIDMAVGGQPVEIINQIGWPGEQNLYRLDFRMPKTSGSMASLQLTAAWIGGPAFMIPVQ